MDTRINVANDFSRYPAGRYIADGPFSGEAFRKKFLLPAVREGRRLVIELDGVRGYGSSFLEEAFGGIVREGFEPAAIRRLIQFESKDPSLLDEIAEYIEDGAQPADE